MTWGSELTLPWENFCDIIILQFVGHPPGGMRFDYIVSAPLLPSHCDFFFVFGRFQSSLLLIVQQFVVILMFLWEEVNSRSSTPPSCLLSSETESFQTPLPTWHCELCGNNNLILIAYKNSILLLYHHVYVSDVTIYIVLLSVSIIKLFS